MSDLVQRFQQFYRNGTRQIGPYFCIPAVVSNAIRVLGSDEYTQEKIRDSWYAMKGRNIEEDVNQQMTGAGTDVVEALEKNTAFTNYYTCARFEQESGKGLYDQAKAEKSIQFITEHVGKGSPVLVSTDHIPWERGILTRTCCHMWLVLQVEDGKATCHDPDIDLLFEIPISMGVHVALGGQATWIQIGLSGRITATNYFCLAISKK